jgi:hypothetical protein
MNNRISSGLRLIAALAITCAGQISSTYADEPMTPRIVSDLKDKNIDERFIPDVAEGLVDGDTSTMMTDELVSRSNDAYYAVIAEKFKFVASRISKPLKCDSFELKRRVLFFHEKHFAENPGKSPAGEWYHDIWSFQGCGRVHHLHLSVIEAARPFPPIVILVGDTTATALLIMDVARPIMASTMATADRSTCGQEIPTIVSARPSGNHQPGDAWDEEWVAAYCKQLVAYTVHFTPTPADGGTDYAIKQKHKESY